MPSNTRSRVIAPVIGAAIILTMLSPAMAGAGAPSRARGAGQLRDLQTSIDNPTDHATAQIVATESGGKTTVSLKVQGLDHGAAGATMGAHVHVGPCVEGNGGAAGPHYNSSSDVPPVINDQTEVWLDFIVEANGQGRASATVPFLIPEGGAGSAVIHMNPTDHAGAAGARLACIPVAF
ncbi:MAG TPA: superoxide dismutase family protein [Ilumatobacteraceae bacterium]|nr:superoxide dismutase family protein [Ilumatobacteraceae bacterium]